MVIHFAYYEVNYHCLRNIYALKRELRIFFAIPSHQVVRELQEEPI